MGTEKEKSVLNHYLGSLQSLKHTCHLRIRLGGFCGRESCEEIGETLLFSLPNFSKAKPGEREFLSNERFLGWAILYLNCWL